MDKAHIHILKHMVIVNVLPFLSLTINALGNSELDELNKKVQFSSKVPFLANFELNLVHFFPKELELNESSIFW